MSDAFYIDIRDNTVKPLLVEFGTSYDIVTPGTYDPGSLSMGVEVKRSATGLVSEGSMVDSFGFGGVNQWASKKVLLIDPSADIERNETIIVEGVEHDLNMVEKLQPANINLLYILDLSK